MTAHACPICGDRHHTPDTPTTCQCGHPEIAHHLTPGKRRTRCSVWNPGLCLCQLYMESEINQ